MEYVMYLALILIGACLGSFAGATVWRLRARQLAYDKKHKEPVDAAEFKQLEKLTKRKLSKDRSQCLHCGYTLKWYDLVPIVSWLALKGKCRNCHKSIGYFELLIELGVAAFFVISYAFWPFELATALDIARFIIWLIAGVILAMLVAYDTKWYLLPDKLTVLLAGLGAVTVVIAAIQSTTPIATILSAVGAVAILSGLYFALYLVSKGRWVGFGDVKLGIGLALLLGDWSLALIALFLANFVGCLIVLPFMIAGKLKRNSRVPFGPLLIIGMILSFFIGPALVELYTFGLI
jgi:prepilin signal peptidase PulO-like enzyme (type II secretory pathway)